MWVQKYSWTKYIINNNLFYLHIKQKHSNWQTYKSSFQIPAPAVVEETNNDGSGKVTNQDGQVGDLNVWHCKLHKLLQQHKDKIVIDFYTYTPFSFVT